MLFVTTHAHAQCSAFNDGLVGHWTLDEGSGTFADSSPNSNTGTQTGGVEYSSSGIISDSAGFGGSNDYINVSHDASLTPAQDMTIAFWMRINEDWDDLANNIWRLMGKKSGASDSSAGWSLMVNSWGDENIEFRAGNGSISPPGLGWSSGLDWDVGVWYHIVVVWEQNGTLPSLSYYRNGSFLNTSTASGSFSANWGSDDLRIGRGYWDDELDGAIDDVRIYNRVLSDDEIAALYALRSTADPVEGEIVYNTKNNLMQYCDGTDWRVMGIGSYTPDAVSFDGSNDWLDRGTIAGVSDGQKGTVSVWFYADDVSADRVIYGQTSGRMNIWYDQSVGQLRIRNENSANSGVVDFQTSSLGLSTGQWHHLLASWDTSVPVTHLYIDDVSDHNETFATVDMIDYDWGNNFVGTNAGSTDFWDGNLADLWFDFNGYIDFSSAENRRKFISDKGMPVYLGENGSIPTGEPPEVFLTGGAVEFSSNRGTGGAFTENGALSFSSSSPGNCTPDAGPFVEEDLDTTYTITSFRAAGWHDGRYYYAGLNNDGIAAYTFDGTNLTIAGKSASQKISSIWGDGNYIYATRGVSTDLKAFTFDGSTFTEVGSYDTATTTYTVGGDGTYIYMVESGGTLRALTFDGSNFNSVGTQTGLDDYNSGTNVEVSNGYIFVANGNVDGLLAFTFDGSSFTQVGSVNPGGYTVGVTVQWPYIYAVHGNSGVAAYTFDGSTFTPAGSVGTTMTRIWSDGTYVYTGDDNELNAYSHDGSTLSLENSIALTGANGTNGIYGDGTYIYVAGNAYGVAAFSGFGTCSCGQTSTGNIAQKGLMTYEPNYNVMQYCNGTEWVAMGPIGGQDVQNGLVGHWKLDETSGSSITDHSGNSNTGTWADDTDNVISDESVTALVDTGLDLSNSDGSIITVSPSATLNNQTARSACAWAKPQSPPAGYNAILNKADASDNGWNLYYKTGTNARWGFYTNEYGYAETGNYTLRLNEWQHLCGTWDGTDGFAGIKVYMDGVEVTPTYTGDLSGSTADDSAEDLAIGGLSNGTNEHDGQLDDVRLYNRVLSASEVAQIYQFGLSGGLGDVDNGCTSPARDEGVMLYNNDHNVLQYCNGEEWIKIGH